MTPHRNSRTTEVLPASKNSSVKLCVFFVSFVLWISGTAGYQAVKAALIDPAETLRNE